MSRPTRVVIKDWKRVWGTAQVCLSVIIGTGAFGFFGLPFLYVGTAIGLLLLPFSVYSQIKGVVLEGRTLAFPNPFLPYIGRNTATLSEINDANAEFFARQNPDNAILRLFGSDANGKTDTRNERIYCVNLSGTFGSHSIRFQEKRKRDQLLSELRIWAPHIKITRWS